MIEVTVPINGSNNNFDVDIGKIDTQLKGFVIQAIPCIGFINAKKYPVSFEKSMLPVFNDKSLFTNAERLVIEKWEKMKVAFSVEYSVKEFTTVSISYNWQNINSNIFRG